MSEKTLDNLNMRRTIAQACIKTLDRIDGDPRKPDAMEYYKAQLASIDSQIAKITGKPPPVVVGLNTASLTGQSGLK